LAAKALKAKLDADERRKDAEKLSNENAILAAKALKAKLDADERRKNAETLAVQLKFEHAFQQPDEKRALSILSTASLLREAIVLENRALKDSLCLHIVTWIGEVHELKSILSHKDAIRAMAFSPDGKTVLTGSDDNTARLWETASGKPLGLPPLQHKGRGTHVAFSPDGKTVLTGSAVLVAR
jgi:hypothetical protein